MIFFVIVIINFVLIVRCKLFIVILNLVGFFNNVGLLEIDFWVFDIYIGSLFNFLVFIILNIFLVVGVNIILFVL